MIIGICGKMGSGKDTLGEIIRDLTKEMNNLSFSSGYVYTWEIKKFAGKLKQIASLILGVPVEKFESQEFKATSLGPQWDNMTGREFLQKLGTDACRTNIHTNIWVNALFADYNPKGYWPEAAWPGEIPNWIITDCRFPNEA